MSAFASFLRFMGIRQERRRILLKSRKLLSLLLALVLVFALSGTAYANLQRSPSAGMGLSYSGTTANCWVTATEAGQDIRAVMTLWHEDGTYIDSWSDSGHSAVTVNGSTTVESGETYVLKAYVTINGTMTAVAPMTRTCP